MEIATEEKKTANAGFEEINTADFLGGIEFDDDPDGDDPGENDDEPESDPDDDQTPDSADEIEKILNAGNPIREGAKAIRKMNAEKPTESQPAAEPTERPKSKLQPKAMAKFYVATVDLALDKICGFIAKKPNGKEFRLTPEERVDYLDISTAFFEATNIQFSPTIAFGVVSALLLGGNVVSAIMQRKEAGKIVKMRTMAERSANAAPPVQNEAGQIIADPIFAAPKGVRRKWKIDSDGRFCYNVAGDYYFKQGERREVCPANVVAFIRDYEKNNGGSTPKDSQVNKFVYGK